jgi:hypothetical protein
MFAEVRLATVTFGEDPRLLRDCVLTAQGCEPLLTHTLLA